MSRILTARTLETIEPGPERREIPDRHMPGLYLVVTVRTPQLGDPLSAGRAPAQVHPRLLSGIRSQGRRERAAKALRAVAEGAIPAGRRSQRATSSRTPWRLSPGSLLTCSAAARIGRARLGGRSSFFDQHVLPRWRRRLIQDITRRDVLDLLDAVVAAGRPVAANRVLTAVRTMFNWATERDILAVSPCIGVKPPTLEQSRDRVLTDTELRDIWLAVERLGGPYAALGRAADAGRRPAGGGVALHHLGRGRPAGPAVDAAQGLDERLAARSRWHACTSNLRPAPGSVARASYP